MVSKRYANTWDYKKSNQIISLLFFSCACACEGSNKIFPSLLEM